MKETLEKILEEYLKVFQKKKKDKMNIRST